MDNEGQNKNPGSASGTQGIFSSPDLTVDTGKIARTSSEGSHDKSRVTSFFANTDASQRAQQLNNVMNTPEAEQTGDAVINNELRKNSKLPIIMATVVITLVVIGLAGFLITKTSQPSKTNTTSLTAKEAFSDYLALLQKGPKSLRDTYAGGKWFIFTANNSLEINTLQTYINDINNEYDIFLPQLSDSGLSTEDLTYYASLFGIVSKNASLGVIEENLLHRYLDAGGNAAWNYINEMADFSEEGDEYAFIKSAYDSLHTYLSAELNLIKMYDGWNCISGRSIDYACVQDRAVTSTTYGNLYNQKVITLAFLGDYIDILQPSFEDFTKTLSNLVGGKQSE